MMLCRSSAPAAFRGAARGSPAPFGARVASRGAIRVCAKVRARSH
jgi:hypothetical protein